MPRARRLVVNADDFGFTRDVNEGIVRCLRHGILRSTTLMANGAAFDDAVRLAGENPGLDVGCHLVLIGGESVSSPVSRLPATIPLFLRSLPSAEWLAREFRAQVEKTIRAGIRPTHLDTHKHTHLLPKVREAVLQIAEEYEIPWVRRPFDLPLGFLAPNLHRALAAAALHPLQKIPFTEALARRSLRATDYFAGFRMTGGLQTEQLLELFERLPAGTGELMCHPGICGAELRAAPTRLQESREAELRALTSPRVRRRAADLGIDFVSFADLSAELTDSRAA